MIDDVRYKSILSKNTYRTYNDVYYQLLLVQYIRDDTTKEFYSVCYNIVY